MMFNSNRKVEVHIMIKKIVAFSLVGVLLSCSVSAALATEPDTIYKEIYVSVSGDDANDGSSSAPFKTINRAKQEVASISDSMTGDIVVNISEGNHFLDKQLEFDVSDSGKNGHNVIYRGAGADKTVISGGRPISGFEKWGDKGIYRVKLNGVQYINELYVNGVRRDPAGPGVPFTALLKSDKYLSQEYKKLYPNINVDPYIFDDPQTEWLNDGIIISKKFLDTDFINQNDIVISELASWLEEKHNVEKIVQYPDDPDYVIVYFEQPNYELNPISGTLPLRLSNVFEHLDSPGEFYYNRTEGYLYYIPTEKEDMASAEIIYPVLTDLLHISGNDIDDKIKNITFEHMKFAHTTDYAQNEVGGVSKNQTSALFSGYGGTQSAVSVSLYKAENINFYNNYFFGLGLTGIGVRDGNDSCNIIGNAFSDLGGAAVDIGETWHADWLIGEDGVSDAPPKDEKLRRNLIDVRTPVFYSYLNGYNRNYRSDYVEKDGGHFFMNYVSFKTYADNYEYGGAWLSGDYPVSRGEKSWLKYDLGKEYKIEEIVLAFDKELISEEERSNYEVLLSNDREFKTYETALTKTNPSDEYEHILINKDEEYRYIMFRSLGANKIGLSRMWAFSPELKPNIKFKRNNNIKFENNYIKRVSLNDGGLGGVNMYFGDNCSISHNDISYIAYSGIMVGYGWFNHITGNRGHRVSNNYVHDTSRIHNDGAPIYTLGVVEGVFDGNYVDDGYTNMTCFYLDEGSSSETWTNNIGVDAAYTFRAPAGYIGQKGKVYLDNIIKDNYAFNINIYTQPARAEEFLVTNKIIEKPNAINELNQDKYVYAIKAAAGVETPYAYLKELIPQEGREIHEPYYMYFMGSIAADASTFYDSMKEEINSLYNNGIFGTSLGEYPARYKALLNQAMRKYEDTPDTVNFIFMRNVMKEARKEFKRYTLGETIKLCEDILEQKETVAQANKSNVGKYRLAEAEMLRKAIREAKEFNGTKVEEYSVLTKLEQAYKAFEESVVGGRINYLNVDGMLKADIDYDSKTISVVMPVDAKMDEREFEIFLPEGVKLARNINKINLAKSNVIPIYDTKSKVYTYWDVSAVYEDEIKNTTNDNWTTLESGEKIIEQNNNTVIMQGPFPAISKNPMKNDSVSVKFIPFSQGLDDFTFVFSANSAEKYNIHSARYEVKFTKNKAILYYVKDGIYTELESTYNPGICSSETNYLTVISRNIGENKYIDISLNGNSIINLLTNKIAEGKYFGFASDTNVIHVLKNN